MKNKLEIMIKTTQPITQEVLDELTKSNKDMLTKTPEEVVKETSEKYPGFDVRYTGGNEEKDPTPKTSFGLPLEVGDRIMMFLEVKTNESGERIALVKTFVNRELDFILENYDESSNENSTVQGCDCITLVKKNK